MSTESTSAIFRNQVDLLDFIDWTGVECLNQNTSHPFPNAMKQGYREDEGLNLESDADEQLLIYIPFTQVIKLHSIVIKGPEEEGPQNVKLYTNREHMGFSNVGDFPPSDTLALSPENLKVGFLGLSSMSRRVFSSFAQTIIKELVPAPPVFGGTKDLQYLSIDICPDPPFRGKPVILKYVKFQNVRSLTIFIEDNQSGSDITKVQKIILQGTTVETTDMKGLKKIEDH